MPTRSADYSTSQQTPATADTPGAGRRAEEHLLTVTNMIITMAMLTGAGRVASC